MRPNWFVALPVPPGPWLEHVTSPPANVRCFHPEDLHLTVAFLGGIAEPAAMRAFELARAIPLAACDVRLGAVVPMGNPRRPSALSARLLEGEPQVARAIGAVRDAVCDAAGVPRDVRPPLPHLTLARPRRNASREERASAVRWAEQLALGAPTVRLASIALYTWAPERRERLFTIVAQCPLAHT